MTDTHHQRRAARRAAGDLPDPPRQRARLRPAARAAATVAALAGLVLVLVAVSVSAAWAQDAPLEPGVSDLTTVVNNIRIWLVGILFAVSTLYLTIGGFRYIWSNGDPGEVEKAKSAFRNAAVGYALAVLAPLVVTIVTSFLL